MIAQTKTIVRRDGVGWKFEGGEIDGKTVFTHDLGYFRDQEVIVKFKPFSRGGTFEILSVIIFDSLIAAAQELLDALEAYQIKNRLHNDSDFDLYNKAALVIAKAKGESKPLVTSEVKSE